MSIAACGGPAPEGPPEAPSSVTTIAGPGYITVSWTDNSTNETGFEVYRASTAQLAFAPQQLDEPIATLAADSTSYVDLDIELETEYDYQVVAVGPAGSSAGAAAAGPTSVHQGVDILVGTVDRVYSDDTTGTVFIFYLVFDETVLQDPNVEITIALDGPPGWNGDSTVSATIPSTSGFRELGFARLQLHNVDSFAGTYTFTAVVDGSTYEATAELADPSYRLGRPSDLDVAVSSDETQVTATWTTQPDAVTTYASIHTGHWEMMLSRSPAQGSTNIFTNLDLDDGLYLVDIMSLNVDLENYPIKVEPFGQSAMYAPFGIGDPQSALCDSPEQAIDIPDAALRDAVLHSLYRQSGVIKCVDLLLLEWLRAENSGVVSLEGLQYADNLLSASLGSHNEITSIEQLRGLPKLHSVSLWGSPISDVSPLEGMTTLLHLDFGGTLVTDISFLEELTDLESFYFWNQPGVDLTPLHGLTKLRTLALSGNALIDEDVAFIEHLTELQFLYIDFNELTHLAPLVANAGLGSGDEVRVNDNRLDLTDASTLADIQTLVDRGVQLVYEEQK